jgi:integrase
MPYRRSFTQHFKAAIPDSKAIAVPDWVKELQKTDPNVPVWQFRFSESETKMKNRIHAVVPRCLITLLEEYLTFRRQLIQRADPGTLFLTKKGTAYKQSSMGGLVSTLTMRYGKRRVSPHRFRDIVAYAWLEDHPEGYLMLSKILWHKNIQMTIRVLWLAVQRV